MTNSEYEFDHMKIERESISFYRNQLIDGIIEFSNGKLKKETLKKYSIRTLERIFDNC